MPSFRSAKNAPDTASVLRGFLNRAGVRLWPLFCVLGVSATFAQQGPETLTYDEIIQLYKEDVPPEPLAGKLQRLLTTPFLDNSASDAGVTPVNRPSVRSAPC